MTARPVLPPEIPASNGQAFASSTGYLPNLFTTAASSGGEASQRSRGCDNNTILDVTSGHKGMQKEIAKRFGIEGGILSVDVRPQMTNGMKPDIVADSRALPFGDSSFGVILFDPPFSFHGGKSCGGGDYSRFYVTYGLNLYTSRVELGEYIAVTFREVWRVLDANGSCLFKWSESRIKLDWALSLRGGFHVAWKWPRPSKHWGTKTGTHTWYVCLTKSPGVIPAVAEPTATLTAAERVSTNPSTAAQADNATEMSYSEELTGTSRKHGNT